MLDLFAHLVDLFAGGVKFHRDDHGIRPFDPFLALEKRTTKK
jgi:hypothetical protein